MGGNYEDKTGRHFRNGHKKESVTVVAVTPYGVAWRLLAAALAATLATAAGAAAALLLENNRTGNLFWLGRDFPRELLGSFRATLHTLTSFLCYLDLLRPIHFSKPRNIPSELISI